MACANERSPHPSELFGENWMDWSNDLPKENDDSNGLTHGASTAHNWRAMMNTVEAVLISQQ